MAPPTAVFPPLPVVPPAPDPFPPDPLIDVFDEQAPMKIVSVATTVRRARPEVMRVCAMQPLALTKLLRIEIRREKALALLLTERNTWYAMLVQWRDPAVSVSLIRTNGNGVSTPLPGESR